MQKARDSAGFRLALVSALCLGALLRTIQYAAQTSLWIDELAIALNVTRHTWSELLLHPLDYRQVAPVGFLALEKAVAMVVGQSEAGLRLLPYLLSLASLVLFWRVSTRYLRDASLLAALLAFALSPTLIVYAGTVKQYSGDVVVSLLLLLLALRFVEGATSRSESVVAGIAGGGAILLSLPATLVALGLLSVLILERRPFPATARRLLPLGLGWATGAAVVTYASLTSLSPGTASWMHSYWKSGFMPPPWEGWRELAWIPTRLISALAHFALSITPGTAKEVVLAGSYGVLLFVGIVWLARTKPMGARLLAVPFIVAILAAAARLLPLEDRAGLFIGPSLLIMSYAGFDAIRGWLPRQLASLPKAAAFGLAIFPATMLLVQSPPPMRQDETRPVLERIREEWKPGDELIVSRLAALPMEFYGRRLGFTDWTRLQPASGGGTPEQILRGFLATVDEFRGAPRVWLFMDLLNECERQTLVGYLDSIGRKLLTIEDPYGARGALEVSAHLYDLGDRPDAGVSPATYPLPRICGELPRG